MPKRDAIGRQAGDVKIRQIESAVDPQPDIHAVSVSDRRWCITGRIDPKRPSNSLDANSNFVAISITVAYLSMV
jgi:hypothetical protein